MKLLRFLTVVTVTVFGGALPACSEGEAAAETDATELDVAMSDAGDDTASPPADAVNPGDEVCSTAGLEARWTIEGLSPNGDLRVGYVDLDATDPSRKTAGHGNVPEADGRRVGIRVYYPAVEGPLGPLTPEPMAPLARGRGPFPLLVHSHGFSSNKDELSYAARWLATRGWVVATLEFPLTNFSVQGGPLIADVINQPGDVRFAIDQILAQAAAADSPIFGAIDAERLALSGVSLGGLTTFLTTFHRDWHDPRVKAAIDIAGPGGYFNEVFYSFVDTPVFIIHGDIDAIVDYPSHALPARAHGPAGSRLLTMLSASHTGFANAAALFESAENADSIGCGIIQGQGVTNEDFLSLMVDPEIGVVDIALPPPCDVDTFPPAMRPSRQTMLTRLALYGWLELQLGGTEAVRASACDLLKSLAAEDDLALE